MSIRKYPLKIQSTVCFRQKKHPEFTENYTALGASTPIKSGLPIVAFCELIKRFNTQCYLVKLA